MELDINKLMDEIFSKHDFSRLAELNVSFDHNIFRENKLSKEEKEKLFAILV